MKSELAVQTTYLWTADMKKGKRCYFDYCCDGTVYVMKWFDNSICSVARNNWPLERVQAADRRVKGSSIVAVNLLFLIRRWRYYERETVVKTAPGGDNIPYWVFQNSSYELADVVAHIYNCALRTGIVPHQWFTAVISPAPKTSHPETLLDFRPISVTPILSRIIDKTVVLSTHSRSCFWSVRFSDYG